MKKIVSLLFMGVLLTSCVKNESILERKIICSEQAQKYTNLHKEITILENFYSPVLDTCLAITEYKGSRASLTDFDYSNNARQEDIIDIISDNKLGGIAYIDNFGFEDPNYLPKICNRDYSKGIKKESAGHWIGSSFQVNEVPKEPTKIYKMEKAYRNCVDYLKGENTNNDFSGIWFTPTQDEAPIIWSD